jgi:CBS domain-containing protein
VYKVRDVMTSAPVSATTATSVAEARRLLQQHRIRHLPVLDAATGRLVGIVSDRDVTIGDPELARSLAALQSDLVHGQYRQVEAVMTSPVRTIGPDVGVDVAAQVLFDHRIGALPVVSRDRLVGIITTADVLRGVVAAGRLEAVRSDYGRHPMLAMPRFGDTRPGRPEDRRTALVVQPDAATRVRLMARLAAEGYDAYTCPGPTDPTLCPAREGPAAPRCPRLPAQVDLVVIDEESARTHLGVYEAWNPGVPVRISPGSA